MERFEV